MFQNNIKHYRELSGMSQQELADKLGISQKMISCYESGVKNPKVNTLPVIAKILGVTPNDLLGVR
jgi:transcriptional regulator with XRE-family HTH domain